MFVFYLAAAAVVLALLNMLFTGAPFFATLLAWLLGVQVGLGALWAFLGHYYKSDEVAAYIGWRPGSPFQKEIAFTNLALGVCGVLAFFLRHSPLRDGFWLATILFATCFLVGAFTVHARDLRVGGNKKPGNAGPVFFADIGMPVILWVLYWLR
ncbi:hypothetical protein DND132_3290 [Pseudodesulfovibrio mercurii]|uniref:Uncharacterized protein n=1 Tax=Pseudodesulfovibrio mercurii TaxID=641491 RepID=F0JKP4_9BACT|nr:DUF6790 family protein [Pseudodesulfovibrio mercurii]EGB16493.1 hypothetical protein DND132_3290 [Pseudodesulfovibrio mercurii]